MPEQWRAIVALAGDYVFQWIVETNGDYIADLGRLLTITDTRRPEMNCIYVTKNAGRRRGALVFYYNFALIFHIRLYFNCVYLIFRRVMRLYITTFI